MNKESEMVAEQQTHPEEGNFFELDSLTQRVMTEVPYEWRNDWSDPKIYEAYFKTPEEGIKELLLQTGLINIHEEEEAVLARGLFEGIQHRSTYLIAYEEYEDSEKKFLKERGIEGRLRYDVSPSIEEEKGYQAINHLGMYVRIPTFGENKTITKHICLYKGGENISDPATNIALLSEQEVLLKRYLREEAENTLEEKKAEEEMLDEYHKTGSFGEAGERHHELSYGNWLRWSKRSRERYDNEHKVRWQAIQDAKEIFLPTGTRTETDDYLQFSEEERNSLTAGYDTAFQILHDYVDQKRFLGKNFDTWNGTVDLRTSELRGDPVSLYSDIRLGIMENGDIAQWYQGTIDTSHQVFMHKGYKVSGTLPTVSSPTPEVVIPQVAGNLSEFTNHPVEVINWENVMSCFYWGVNDCSDDAVDSVALRFHNITLNGTLGERGYKLELPIFIENKFADTRLKTDPVILGNIAEFDDHTTKETFIARLLDDAEQQAAFWSKIKQTLEELGEMKQAMATSHPEKEEPLTVGYTHLSYDRWGGTEWSHIKPGTYPGPPRRE